MYFIVLLATFLFLFTPVLTDEGGTCDAFKDYADDTLSENQVIERLFQLCVADSTCKQIFYQNHIQNISVFRFFVFQYFEDRTVNMFYPIETHVCQEDETFDIEAVNDALWLLILYGMRVNQRYLCDINKIPVVSDDNVLIECRCREDKICSANLHDTNFYYIILSFVLMFGFMQVMAAIARQIKTTKQFGSTTQLVRRFNKVL